MVSVTSMWQRFAPAATLMILSPVMAEVLFGATHLTTLFLLLPQICIYGSAALIIREVVRRQNRSWLAILFLGIAYAILQEGVILQTSVSPMLFGGDPSQIYSWALGVNWVYLLWAVVYESIWAIVLPIQFTELIFPNRRNQSWAGNRGLAAATITFLAAAAIVWYRFTQIGIYPGGAYEAPLPVVVAAVIAAAVFAAAAFTPWTVLHKSNSAARSVPHPWLVGLAAFGLGLPWFILPVLVFAGPASLSFEVPIGFGLAWLAGALFLLHRWMDSPAWQDAHRLSLVSGALAASMLAGFLESGIQLPVDLIGKLVFDGLAVLMLIFMSRKMHHGML